ncbi:MAG TPA: DUF4856 domain-containing protein [Chitinophagaceae bacterium]|nr:DUF4856 domain-containing protein [Chitinophagaceae bacterium]
MKDMIVRFSALALLATGFTACDKNDNPDENNGVQFRPQMSYNNLTATSNYLEIFKDAQGNQTVDFSGQTLRQDMMAELDSVMRIPAGAHAAKGVPAGAVSATLLKNMYAHTASPFRQAALNAAADKQLKAKTAGSFSAVAADAERARFDGWLEKVATASQSFDKVAADGQAGMAVTNNGSKYLVDEKGIEYGQLVQKGLIGALLMDQMLNVYLGTEKLSLDNTKLVDGKFYTAREHSWDEAYGYLTKNAVYPTPNPADPARFLERYLGTYVRPIGNAADLYVALLKGRAAVVNNDNATRDAQVALIRQHVEKALATFAISYLNRTKEALASDPAVAMHNFGEGAGFVYALRFGPSGKISVAKSDEQLNKLIGGTKGFYSLTPAIIDEVRNEIATLYNIDPTTKASHS